jgi:microcystin-dependent protein
MSLRRAALFAIACAIVTFSAAAQSTLPPGSVVAFAGKTSSGPRGWLLCDGREVSVSKYPALFKAIGTIYGGDGVNKFRLPDLRGRVVIGVGQGGGLTDRTLGVAGGEENHTLTAAEIPPHSHTQTLDDRTGGGTGGIVDANGGGPNAGVDNGKTRSDGGGGGAHNNMQPYLVLHYLIKY